MLHNNKLILFQEHNFKILFDRIVNSNLEKKITCSDKTLIHIADSSNWKSACRSNPGKWRFITENLDHTCGLYNAIEIVRQAILSTKLMNQNAVEIALVYSKDKPNYFYLVDCNRQTENHFDVERLKKGVPYLTDYKKCECHPGICENVLSHVFKPAMKALLHSIGFRMDSIILKDKIVSERSDFFTSMHFLRDLKAIRIEWGTDPYHPIRERLALLESKDEALTLVA